PRRRWPVGRLLRALAIVRENDTEPCGLSPCRPGVTRLLAFFVGPSDPNDLDVGEPGFIRLPWKQEHAGSNPAIQTNVFMPGAFSREPLASAGGAQRRALALRL